MIEVLDTPVQIVGGACAVGMPLLFLAVALAAVYGALGECGVSLALAKLVSVGLGQVCCALVVLCFLGQAAAVVAVSVFGVEGVAAGAMAAAAGATVTTVAVAVGAGRAARRVREIVDRLVAAFAFTVTYETFVRILLELELSAVEMTLITIAIFPLLQAAVAEYPTTLGLAAAVLLTWLDRSNQRQRRGRDERNRRRQELEDDEDDNSDDDD